MDAQNFSQLFKIIYDKFIAVAKIHGFKESNIGFSEFLGHEHDGRVRAWKGGQWPNAQDCLLIADKLDFDLKWIITGKEELLRQDQPEGKPVQDGETAHLLQPIAALERENDLLRKLLAEKDKRLALYERLLPEASPSFPDVTAPVALGMGAAKE